MFTFSRKDIKISPCLLSGNAYLIELIPDWSSALLSIKRKPGKAIQTSVTIGGACGGESSRRIE
jgi:hypothetical protein